MAGGWLASDHSLVFNSLPPASQQPACDLQLLRPTESRHHSSFPGWTNGLYGTLLKSAESQGICNRPTVDRKPQLRSLLSEGQFRVQYTSKTCTDISLRTRRRKSGLESDFIRHPGQLRSITFISSEAVKIFGRESTSARTKRKNEYRTETKAIFLLRFINDTGKLIYKMNFRHGTSEIPLPSAIKPHLQRVLRHKPERPDQIAFRVLQDLITKYTCEQKH